MPRPRNVRPSLLVVALGLCCAVASHAAAAVIVDDPGQGLLPISGQSAGSLSGLTFAGGTSFYAVSDKNAQLFDLTIQVNPATGTIDAASIDAVRTLVDGADLEDVEFDPSDGRILVADEQDTDNVGPAIRRHNLADGTVAATVALPSVLDNIRANLALEALALAPDGRLWTANEEALNGDGPAASAAVGSAVRLVEFNAAGNATGQWAYVTDPYQGENATIGSTAASGLVDLLALADGSVLALERALGGSGFLPYFRSRIYLVDFAGATDVSGLPQLDTNGNASVADEAWTAVSKTLLWEQTFSFTNFESLTLGPTLADGRQSLLLVSDDGAPLNTQSLYALTLEATPVPEPSTWLLAIVGGALLLAATGHRVLRGQRVVRS